MVCIAENVREARLRCYRHVRGRNELELVRHNEVKTKCEVVGIAKKAREASLRWYGYVIRYRTELVRDIMQ